MRKILDLVKNGLIRLLLGLSLFIAVGGLITCIPIVFFFVMIIGLVVLLGDCILYFWNYYKKDKNYKN